MSNALLQRTYIAGYHAANEEDDGDVKYYGSLGFNGAWVIEKWDTVATDAVGLSKTHHFIRGVGGYAAAWLARRSLTYVTFDEAFA